MAAALRLHDLAADPPVEWLRRRPTESPSGAFLSDEGWYNRNARRFAQDRRPVFRPGALDTGWITPAYTFLQGAVLRVAGVSLVTARMTSALAGTLTVLLLLLLLGAGPLGLAAALVVACDFVLVSYSRLALPDSLGILVTLAAGLAACRGRPSSAGALSVLAYAVKPPYLLPALCGALAAITRGDRARFLFGVAGAATVFALLIVVPHHAELQSLASRHAPKRGLRIQAPLGFLREGVWWVHWGPLLPLAVIGASSLCPYRDRATDPRVRWATGSLVGSLLAVAPFTYQPLRYHLAYVIPATTLAASLAERSRRARWLVASALLALLAFDAHRFATFRPSHTLRDAARDAGIEAGPDAVVLGHLADTFALEAGWEAVVPSIEAETDAAPRVRALRPTYLLTLRPGEPARWSHALLDAPPPRRAAGSWDVLGNYYSGHPVQLWILPVAPGGHQKNTDARTPSMSTSPTPRTSVVP